MYGSYASHYARQASKAGHAERVKALAGRIAPLLPFVHDTARGPAEVTKVTFDSSRITLLSKKGKVASYAPDTMGWYDLWSQVNKLEASHSQVGESENN